ncbi:MAG: hypothetical protein ACI8X5_000265 [Planctomycetota bacterium]|jgi:hypothetical protein
MNSFDPVSRMNAEFKLAFDAFLARPAVARFVTGNASLAEYGSYMRQVFHQTRENPQAQAHATAYFRGSQRKCIKAFLKHAVSELSHDMLALNDLKNLEIPMSNLVDQIPSEQPLPETSALIAFAYYQMQYLDPVGYLGCVYFLEFMPTSIGADAQGALDKMGVPAGARSFIADHVAIDVAHNKLMESYLRELVPTEKELAVVAAAMRVTGRLYANMIEAAFEAAAQEGLEPLVNTECDQELTYSQLLYS